MSFYNSKYSTQPEIAIKLFFAHRPALDRQWKPLFIDMLRNGIDDMTDTFYPSGRKNPYWTYALHLHYENGKTYISLNLNDGFETEAEKHGQVIRGKKPR